VVFALQLVNNCNQQHAELEHDYTLQQTELTTLELINKHFSVICCSVRLMHSKAVLDVDLSIDTALYADAHASVGYAHGLYMQYTLCIYRLYM
jgi:hypothetical protein